MKPERIAEFKRDGVVVVRGLLDSSVRSWQDAWRDWYDPARIPGWNPVEVRGPFPPKLQEIGESWALKRYARDLLCVSGAAPYNFRFLVKDEKSPGAVFLHQDCGYHVGSLPKLSAFVALSSVIPENGGLHFWLGTHRYGYLGDVGEIDPRTLGEFDTKDWCPVLAPGEVVFMDSALWHYSEAMTGGPPRILADVIFQDADDPSRKLPRDGLFKRSRVSRIKELEDKCKAIPK